MAGREITVREALSDGNRNLRSRLACGDRGSLEGPFEAQGKQGKGRLRPLRGKKKTQRDSSLRDPAHKNRAQEKTGSLRSE